MRNAILRMTLNLFSLVLQVRERRQRSEIVSDGVLPCGIVFPGQLELYVTSERIYCVEPASFARYNPKILRHENCMF